MELRALVTQGALLSASLGLLLSAILVVAGYPRVAAGIIYGVGVGAVNLSLLALRVSQIGDLGSAGRARRAMQVGMGMRLLMIGLAAGLAIKLSATINIYGMLVGLLLTVVAANILGARAFLRDSR